MWSAAHLEAFWIKQDMLFLHVSNVLGMFRGMHVQSHTSYVEAYEIKLYLDLILSTVMLKHHHHSEMLSDLKYFELVVSIAHLVPLRQVWVSFLEYSILHGKIGLVS